MTPLILAGSIIVTLALIAYTAGIAALLLRRTPRRAAARLLTAGVLLDITSTLLMIAGSRHTPLTFHGLIGYAALAVMLLDAVLVRRHARTAGGRKAVPRGLLAYSLCAWAWWVFVYAAGVMMAARFPRP